jgi:hypothetical protein
MTDEELKELLAELEAKNPGRELVVYNAKAGLAIFKVPNGPEIDAWRTRHGGEKAKFPEANKALLATCRVHPEAVEFQSMLMRRPFLLEKWIDSLTDAAGADEVIEVKKV